MKSQAQTSAKGRASDKDLPVLITFLWGVFFTLFCDDDAAQWFQMYKTRQK